VDAGYLKPLGFRLCADSVAKGAEQTRTLAASLHENGARVAADGRDAIDESKVSELSGYI
jgi:hypothetical protein